MKTYFWQTSIWITSSTFWNLYENDEFIKHCNLKIICKVCYLGGILRSFKRKLTLRIVFIIAV